MRIYRIALPLLVLLFGPAWSQSVSVIPSMTSVEPDSAKVGDLLVIQGANLDRDHVAALYLTDGKLDVKVPVVEQTSTTIKFKIPPEAKPGRFALMVLTKGKDSKFIEEPVKITIEEITTPTPTPSAR